MDKELSEFIEGMNLEAINLPQLAKSNISGAMEVVKSKMGSKKTTSDKMKKILDSRNKELGRDFHLNK